MIGIEDIIRHENHYVRSCAEVAERDYGVLFYNRDNPASHDSNHALILHLEDDLDAAIADTIAFYRGLGVAPRIYHGFVPRITEVLLPRLLARGFKKEVFNEDYFVCSELSVIKPAAGLEIRRVRKLDPAIRDIFEDEGPWSVGVIARQLQRDSYHLLVGYVENVPVTMAAVDETEKVARVDDVMTHSDHRRKGYARALMHGLVEYHRRVSAAPLYLYSGIPSAIRIYEAAGFRKLDWKPYKWSAWLE
ncbi:MAG: GNAT family N-acetyltransferase [Opitutales bacterium]